MKTGFDDDAPRNRAWLLKLAAAPIADTARTRKYLRAVHESDTPLNLADPGPGRAKDAYNVSRDGACQVGRKAFLHSTPGTSCHHDPALLRDAREGFSTFSRLMDSQGRFILGADKCYEFGTHEHVWRLEPLIWARLWLDNDLSRADKKRIDVMIAKASQYLLAAPRPDFSNQGVVWCYGAWLSGLWLEDDRYINAAEQHATAILERVVDAQGQVKEAAQRYYHGGGPCSNYTFTGWAYIMLYRLISGRKDLDGKLIGALDWLSHYVTGTGLPRVAGASVRILRDRVCVFDTLYAYEFYRNICPRFERVIRCLLPEALAHSGGHAIHPAIWAAKLHRPSPVQPQRAPISFIGHYNNPPSQYTLVTRRYEAGVTFRGLFPFKGLQTFAYRGEPAILHHTQTAGSTVLCGPIDLRTRNVSDGPGGWEVHIRTKGPGSGDESACRMDSITTRRDRMWECYLFTQASVIWMINGPSPLIGRWILSQVNPAAATLDRKQRRVTFEGRKARIRYASGTAGLRTVDGARVLEIKVAKGPLVLALGSGDLDAPWLARSRKQLFFSDATGAWRAGYESILSADGTLRRWWGNIVAPVLKPDMEK